MNKKIKKFLSGDDLSDFAKKYPKVFYREDNPDVFEPILKRLLQWNKEGLFVGKVLKYEEFNDFIRWVFLFGAKSELEALVELLESVPDATLTEEPALLRSALRAYINKPNLYSLSRVRGLKVKIKDLVSLSDKLRLKLANMERARLNGNRALIKLKGKSNSASKDPAMGQQGVKYKRRFILLGEKVLKICGIITAETREKSSLEEIKGLYSETEKFLRIKLQKTTKETAKFIRKIKAVSKKTVKIESLRETLNDALLKIAMEDERFRKAREEMAANREQNQLFYNRARGFLGKLSLRREKSDEIDLMIPSLKDYPFTLSLCKDLISKNREALHSGQKALNGLLAELEFNQADRSGRMANMGRLINNLSELKKDASFYLDTLSKKIERHIVRIEKIKGDIIKTSLSQAEGLIVLDRFMVHGKKLVKGFEEGFSSVRKMETGLNADEETIRAWKEAIDRLAEDETLLVSIKPETLLAAIRNASGLSDIPLSQDHKEDISNLLKKNYAQEKKVNDFELEGISQLISEAPYSSDGFLSGQAGGPLTAMPSRKRARGPLQMFLGRGRSKRRSRSRNMRMEYPESRAFYYAKRVSAFLLLIGAVSYYSPISPFQVDARIVDEEIKGAVSESVAAPSASFDPLSRKTIRAIMYAPRKVRAFSDIGANRKTLWMIFLPIFDDFSIRWNREGRPMLINKDGVVPDAQSLDNMKLFNEIAKRINSEYGGFFSRLYLDFTAQGIPPREAAEFIIENENVSFGWVRQGVEVNYSGKNIPIKALEDMSVREFLNRISPYIIKQYTIYSRNLGLDIPKDLPVYAGMLAEDIYFSSLAFGVPVTSLLSVAHQETFFMNILGDGTKSVGPFQIYEPTRALIIKEMEEAGLKAPKKAEYLEDHITLSTYMAAFHFATLMRRYSSSKRNPITGKIEKFTIDMDRSTRLYNGHVRYPLKVFQKKLLLKRYLEKA